MRLDGRQTDLVVWASAGSPEQIITGYAQAARKVGLSGADTADLVSAASISQHGGAAHHHVRAPAAVSS